MNKVDISVIMPCFNDGEYIEEAVGSVLNQAYKNFEIIIIDDYSSDEKTKIEIKKILKKDKRILAIFLEKNGGTAKARNIAISKAKGKYILPLDADDKIAPTYIEKVLKEFKKDPTVSVVYCDAQLFGLKNGKWNLPEFSFSKMLLQNLVFCSGVYRKSDWKRYSGYNPNMKNLYEDWDFWLNFVGEKKKFYKIPEILFFYRIKENSRNKKSENIKDDAEAVTQLRRNHKKLFRFVIIKKIKRFFFQKKITASGKLRIKILKIPVFAKKLKNI